VLHLKGYDFLEFLVINTYERSHKALILKISLDARFWAFCNVDCKWLRSNPNFAIANVRAVVWVYPHHYIDVHLENESELSAGHGRLY